MNSTGPNSRSYRVRNQSGRSLSLVLEPWATEYLLTPGADIEVVEDGGETGQSLEIQIEPEHVIFFARSGSVLRAYQEGIELP
jgi:hypothetical protein